MSKVFIPQNKVYVIPNGIDLSKQEFKERKKGFNIAYVGYINFKKGPMLLLHAFKKIFDTDNRYKLHIAGTFDEERYRLYFNQMIKELGLEKNIIFYGW
ncbi:TPA: glycosyltransferase [Clostridium botulinum]|uniref:glycosyltransferase n=1 Tax=Clostridium botulinum TaxID=1491 RepID=UPI00211D5E0A|nr:glycosyltransferase [Clostridium botulinum]MCS4446187.1 glycosyltransferase [Clostridium botulinum]MCS4461312.1 glycosyltransferase [Clostridium botulinum]MCS4514749.1 glycosyltransferase [Clostridium botulinum]MCS4520061.1 glycosyltransferase [Clostridium botulinum]UUN85198.1 glycosyltransferase [Clostridium botulinum]